MQIIQDKRNPTSRCYTTLLRLPMGWHYDDKTAKLSRGVSVGVKSPCEDVVPESEAVIMGVRILCG